MTSNYYVDPAAGSDLTGDGSSGAPWATVQHALDTVARDTTYGDRVNVKAGAADTLTGSLNLTTYGAPTAAAPLIIQGYTTTAGDGGTGELDGGGSYGIFSQWDAGNTLYVSFIDMKLGNCGGNAVINSSWVYLLNCEVYGSSAGTGVLFSSQGACRAVGCHFHTLTGSRGVELNNTSTIIGCFLDNIGADYALYIGNNCSAIGNIVTIIGDTQRHGIYATAINTILYANTVYSSAANAYRGIHLGTHSVALNNLVEGYSGANGYGIFTQNGSYYLVDHNAVYNCTFPFNDDANRPYHVLAGGGNNVTLAAGPFADAAGGDFAIPAATTAVTESAYPVGAFKGLATTLNKQERGAVQSGAGAGAPGSGGGRRPKVYTVGN